MITTDKNNPGLKTIKENGQQESYLVLSGEERAKGFVRPYRDTYIHIGRKVEGELRELTEEEKEEYSQFGYYAYVKDMDEESVIAGTYLTKEEFEKYEDGHVKGCGFSTKMNETISETYARDPKFYGGTFCMGCGAHLPVGEFVWEGTDEKVGS